MLRSRCAIRKVLLLIGVLSTTLFVTGCEDHSTNVGGFFFITEDCVASPLFGVPFCINHPRVNVNGSYVKDLSSSPPPAGNFLNFPQGGSGYVQTDATGYYFAQYGRMPAVWNSGVVWNVPCGPLGQTTAVGSFNVTFESPFIGWACGDVIPPPPPQVRPSPQFSLLGSTPAAITIPGTNLSTQYGM